MKNLFLTAILALTFIGAKAQSPNDDLVKVGDKMPAFSIVSDNGEVISSDKFKGKVILINFFCYVVSSLSEGTCFGATNIMAQVQRQ